jgi:hypothetical protein
MVKHHESITPANLAGVIARVIYSIFSISSSTSSAPSA